MYTWRDKSPVNHLQLNTRTSCTMPNGPFRRRAQACSVLDWSGMPQAVCWLKAGFDGPNHCLASIRHVHHPHPFKSIISAPKRQRPELAATTIKPESAFLYISNIVWHLQMTYRHLQQLRLACSIFDLSRRASALTFWASAGHADKWCRWWGKRNF